MLPVVPHVFAIIFNSPGLENGLKSTSGVKEYHAVIECLNSARARCNETDFAICMETSIFASTTSLRARHE